MAEKKQDGWSGIAAGDARHGRGPRAIAATLDHLIARSGQRRGFAEAGLLVDWAEVVGERYAPCTAPERLTRGRDGQPGTLYLRVVPGWATEVQHVSDIILQRINGYLGYPAVGRLVLAQRTGAAPARRAIPAAVPSAEALDALESAVAEIEDPELADALRDLGRAVLHSRSAAKG